MELKYYTLEFTNGKEYLVISDIASPEKVLDKLSSNVIKLQRETSNPLLITKGQLFSVVEVNSAAVGNTSKKWSIVK